MNPDGNNKNLDSEFVPKSNVNLEFSVNIFLLVSVIFGEA